MSTHDIFSRVARRRQRARAANSSAGPGWIASMMAENVAERVVDICHAGQRVLLVGLMGTEGLQGRLRDAGVDVFLADAGFQFARHAGGAQIDEDRLPFADASMDAVLFCGLLDTVNDLPGAFILSRRILRSGGVLIASFLSAPSLEAARVQTTMIDTDLEGRVAARFHPQFDLRVAGDLLLRAGFQNPVTDVDRIVHKYANLNALIDELGHAGLRNCLTMRHPVGQIWKARSAATAAFEEEFTFLNAVAWKDSAPAVPPTE